MQIDDVPINQNIKLQLSISRVQKEIFMYFTLYVPVHSKGWLAIAKLKPLSLFIALLSMLKKAFYNVKIEK